MAGRPRANRASIKGTHLSIRLTEKEVATLDALLVKANAKSQQEHAEAVERWQQLPTVVRAKRSKPASPKPATYADAVRALLQREEVLPRLYETGFWTELKADTEPLDHLVDLANDREAIGYRWNRETMLRKLIEEEWKRKRLKKLEWARHWRSALAEKTRQERWRAQASAASSGTTPPVVCPHCTKAFELPPR